MEKHLRAARERLHIGRVLRENLNHPLRQTVLPTYVRQRSSHFQISTKGPSRLTTLRPRPWVGACVQSNGLRNKEKVGDLVQDANTSRKPLTLHTGGPDMYGREDVAIKIRRP